MKTNITQISKSKLYFRLLPTIILYLGSMLTLSACQKEPEPADTTVQTTPVATSVASDAQIAEVELNNNNAEVEREIDLTELESIDAATSSTQAPAPSPEQAIKGKQITDVEYRSASGASLLVVFETSAAGVLNAIVTLPNKTKMTLSAPEGQGNNPTYRSKDGSIELISHGGGGNIDLMQKGQLTSFEAVSVEAEVVTQP